MTTEPSEPIELTSEEIAELKKKRDAQKPAQLSGQDLADMKTVMKTLAEDYKQRQRKDLEEQARRSEVEETVPRASRREIEEDARLDNTGATRRQGGGMNWTQLLIPLIISLIVSFALVQFMVNPSGLTEQFNSQGAILNTLGAGQKTLTDTATTLQNTYKTLSDQVNALANKVEAHTNALNNMANKSDLTAMQTQLSQLNTTLTQLQTAVSNIPKTDYTSQITALTTQLSALSTQLTNDEKTLTALQATVDGLTTTTTPPSTTTTTGVVTGVVTASYYNSPMVFIKSASTLIQDRTFGITLANGTAKDLVYVALTLTLQSSVNLDNAFIGYGTPVSKSGNFTWSLSQATGNKLVYTADAYIYVASGNEMSDIQTVTLDFTSSTLNNGATVTVSVTSVVINSKTLQ